LNRQIRLQFQDLGRAHAATFAEHIDHRQLTPFQQQLVELIGRQRIGNSTRTTTRQLSMTESDRNTYREQIMHKYKLNLYEIFKKRATSDFSKRCESVQSLRNSLLCADHLAHVLNRAEARKSSSAALFERSFFFLYDPVYAKISSEVNKKSI
jgi:hypothetical protein